MHATSYFGDGFAFWTDEKLAERRDESQWTMPMQITAALAGSPCPTSSRHAAKTSSAGGITPPLIAVGLARQCAFCTSQRRVGRRSPIYFSSRSAAQSQWVLPSRRARFCPLLASTARAPLTASALSAAARATCRYCRRLRGGARRVRRGVSQCSDARGSACEAASTTASTAAGGCSRQSAGCPPETAPHALAGQSRVGHRVAA